MIVGKETCAIVFWLDFLDFFVDLDLDLEGTDSDSDSEDMIDPVTEGAVEAGAGVEPEIEPVGAEDPTGGPSV